MKLYKLALPVLAVSTLFLTGCEIRLFNGSISYKSNSDTQQITEPEVENIDTETDDSENTDVEDIDDKTTDGSTETEIVEITEIPDDYDGLIVYVDSNCTLPVCSTQTINSVMAQSFGVQSGDFVITFINDETELLSELADHGINKFPLVELTDSVYDSVVAQYPQFESMVQKVGDTKYYNIFPWEIGKENICDDSIDNDGDGIIDIDDEDCKKSVLIVDERCDPDSEGDDLCDVSSMTNSLKQQILPVGYINEVVDYSDEKGQTLYNKLNADGNNPNLPILLAEDLDGQIKELLEAQGLLDSIDVDGLNYNLNIFDPKWNPVKADGCFLEDGSVACDKAECSDYQVCIPEQAGLLQVYTMGYCPYGELAYKALPAINAQFTEDSEYKLEVHYIVDKVGEGYEPSAFKSLHGVPEVEENMRQLCITEHYGLDKSIEYMQKRFENADNYGRVTDEPSIAFDAVGIDGEKIETCISSGQAGQLLEKDMQYAKSKGIGASPTWIANDKYQFSGINSTSVINSFCTYNSDFKGCNKDIVDEGGTLPSGSQPSCGN